MIEPIEAQAWIEEMENVFVIMRVGKDQKKKNGLCGLYVERRIEF